MKLIQPDIITVYEGVNLLWGELGKLAANSVEESILIF